MCLLSLVMVLLSPWSAMAAAASDARQPAAADPVAKIQGLLINADDMFRDTEEETVELAGKVQIVKDDEHINADKARIRLRARQVELEGHVSIVTPKATIGGDRIILDYESNTGVIYNGYVQSGSVLFAGALLQKTGPDEYFVVDADYTTCTNCPASWSFTGSSIRAELGGYAYIKNSLLKVGSVPVFWLPYLVVPLKSDRQTGLLTPEFEQSSEGGLAISQSVFWVIDRSSDATFTLRYYDKRGPKGLANYRYVLDENSSGELDIGAIRDRVFQSDPRLNAFRPAGEQEAAVNRWFVRYNHYLELKDGWVQRAVINNASDLQYPKDFPLETLNFGDPAMENDVSFTKNTTDRHFSATASYYINLLQPDPLAGNDDAVHRAPEIRWAQMQKRIGETGFYYSLDLDYTNFARSGPAYDNLKQPSPDANLHGPRYVNNTCPDVSRYGSDPTCRRVYGPYNPSTDLIRTGQRLDFQPSITRPITFADAIDVVPTLAYRETHYAFPVADESTNIRRYVRTEVSGRSTFSRVYGDMVDPRAIRYKHEIKPEITYTVLPWIDHRSHPFFGFASQTEAPSYTGYLVNDTDLAGDFGLQFDFTDRIYDRNLLTYSITNTVTKKEWQGDLPVYRQVAIVKLYQSYDAFEDSRNNDKNKQPWSDIGLNADLRFPHFQTVSQFNYYPYQKVTNSAIRARLIDSSGRFVQVNTTKQFQIVPGQDVNPDTRTEDYTLAAGAITSYLNLMGQVTYNGATPAIDFEQRIKSSTLIGQVKPPGECWTITVIYSKITDSGEQTRVNFDFSFDGVPKPPLPPEELDKYKF